MGIPSFTPDTLPVATSPASRTAQKGSLGAGSAGTLTSGRESWLRALCPRTATSAAFPSVSSPSSPDSCPSRHRFLHCLSLAFCPSGEKHLTLQCRGAGLPVWERGTGSGQLGDLTSRRGAKASSCPRGHSARADEAFQSEIQALKDG